MKTSRKRFGTPVQTIVAGGLASAALAYLYSDVASELVRTWASDSRYSHGFLIPPIAAYLIWGRRQRFLSAERRVNLSGLVVIAASVAALTLGEGRDLFLRGVSLVSALAGTVLLVAGSARFRIIAFPLALLLLIIPLPLSILERIELPLQLGTSQVAEAFITAANVPVLRDGNLLTFRSITLEVAEECSGIRSLISLLTLGLVFGYLPDSRRWPRALLAALTIPCVLFWNGVRVAVTGIGAHHYGRAAAEGFFHDLCGWLAFAAALATMLLLHRVLFIVAPDRKAPGVTARAFSPIEGART